MKDTAPLRILLVEDNANDALLIEQLLEMSDVSLQLAHVADLASAKEHMAGKQHPDAVLLDLWLPDSSGLDTASSIRACAPSVPIIVLAVSGNEEVVLQAVRDSAQAHLLKENMDAVLLEKTLSYAQERKLLQDALQREKQFSAAVMRHFDEGVAVVSADGRFEMIGPGMREILHLGANEEATIRTWLDKKVHNPHERAVFWTYWLQLLSTRRSFDIVLEMSSQDEGLHWSQFHLAVMEGRGLIMAGKDVTMEVLTRDQLAFVNDLLSKQNEQLQKIATIDQLTGVLNRNALYGVAEQQWSRAVRKDEFFSVILMDIDRFNEVNDACGHVVGDMVLERLGNMLNALTRPYDHIGRWSGGEFLVVLPGTSCEDTVLVAERMRANTAAMDVFVDDSTSLKITSSFGVAGREENNVTHLDILLGLADKAVRLAKANGRNCVWRYTCGASVPDA